MSHSVTVTRTITTSSTSAVLINTGYLKTWTGIFKLVQVILGIVNVGLVSYYYNKYVLITAGATFFLLMAVTFLICSFLLLLSCLISISTASIIPKTIFEFIYHGVAFLLYLAASLTLIVEVNNRNRRSYYYEEFFAAGIIGLVISAVYLMSAIWGYRSYKGL